MNRKQHKPLHKFVWAKGEPTYTCGTWSPPWLITDAPRLRLRKRLRDTGKPELIKALSRALSVRTISRSEALFAWAAHVALGERTTARADTTRSNTEEEACR